MYVGYKKTFDTHVLHQVYDRIILHFLTMVLIMSFLYAVQFFVTAADVVTEAFARLVGYQWRFSQRV